MFEKSIWIGMSAKHRGDAAAMFRHEFVLQNPIKQAFLHICGLGYHEAWINSERIGDHQLDPAQTDYDKRCFYVTHDVTMHLLRGINAIGIIIGDGWYNQNKVWEDEGVYPYGQPRLITSLEIIFMDGSKFSIPTDTSWRCSTGAIISSNIYAGETYDAQLEQVGWTSAGFDDNNWENAIEMSSPGGKLQPQNIPPIKEIETINPISIKRQADNSYLIDIGQNISGWARIKINATKGTRINITFAEAINKNGEIDTASTGVFATHVEQIDTYICKGVGIETWQPRFTYHGFRYMKVEGWPGELTQKNITAVVVHTALEYAGSFECSDKRLNKLHNMALWTHRGNVHSIPEDCPARERCGWLGDAHLVCEYSMYNFNSLAFWEKFLDDIETSRQNNNGLPLYIAPGKRSGGGTASPDWMAAMILLPWKLYVFSGKLDLLKKHYNGMTHIMDHFIGLSNGWLLEGGLGDWCDPCDSTFPKYTPEKITTTAWFYECSRIMAEIAELLRKDKQTKKYGEQANKIRSAFITEFYNQPTGSFGSQTADVLALKLGLTSKQQTSIVLESLIRDIQKRETHHTVGIMGMRYLFEMLSRFGHGNLAIKLMHQNTYPSFGDWINRGATTLWEYWGEPEVDKANGPRSYNHPMMGGFDNWFYNTLGGINPDPQKPGFKHILLAPIPPAELKWVRSYYNSPFGRIESSWEIVDGIFKWQINIPENTTATAFIPSSRKIKKLRSGKHNLNCRLKKTRNSIG